MIPSGVDVKIDGSSVIAKGSRGEMKYDARSGFNVVMENGIINITPSDPENRSIFALWGLQRALLSNIIVGVSSGFEKTLEFEGIGYRAILNGEILELSMGFSHPITIKAPVGIKFEIEKNKIKISGIDKQLVGQVAADIKSVRPVEPYKGKGIRYAGEIVQRKAGKKVAGSA